MNWLEIKRNSFSRLCNEMTAKLRLLPKVIKRKKIQALFLILESEDSYRDFESKTSILKSSEI